MALDPLERRLSARLLTLFHPLADTLDEVLVLHALAVRRLPVILLPRRCPHRSAVYAVLAVSDDLHGFIGVDGMEGAEDGGQLGALVCLDFAV